MDNAANGEQSATTNGVEKPAEEEKPKEVSPRCLGDTEPNSTQTRCHGDLKRGWSTRILSRIYVLNDRRTCCFRERKEVYGVMVLHHQRWNSDKCGFYTCQTRATFNMLHPTDIRSTRGVPRDGSEILSPCCQL